MKQKTTNNLLNLVATNYEEIAQEFALSRCKEIWPEIRKISSPILPGASILDLACGNGRLLEAFKDKKIDYLGIDNNRTLIQLARDHYAHKFLVGNILDLTNIKKKFDYIFCLAALQHIPGRELRTQTIKQMAAKLKINGLLILSNWNLWRGKHRQLVFKSYLNEMIGGNELERGDLLFPWKNSQGKVISERYYHAFTSRELKKIAQKANLKIVSLYHDKYNYWLLLKLK